VNDQELAVLMAELRNGGPSPFVPDQEEPWPVSFGDEGQATVGKAICPVFGEPEEVYVFATAYRFILYLRRPRGKDQCRSYWFTVNFGEWAWEGPDGFTVTGLETTQPDLLDDDVTKPLRFAWQTFLLGPAGERRLLEEVELTVLEYYDQRRGGYVAWNQPVREPGLAASGTETQPAWAMFGLQLTLAIKSPGQVNLEMLWVLSQDPSEATGRAGGRVPPDAYLVLRPDSPTVRADSVRVDKSTGEKVSRARKAASKALEVGTQVKDGVERAQKVASVVGGAGGAPGVPGGAPAAQRPGPPPGRPTEVVTSAPSVAAMCSSCGRPMSPGAVFCGKCGQRLAEAVAEEVKDELQGMAEDAMVGKAQEVLKPEEQPKAKGQAKKREAKSSTSKAKEKPKAEKADEKMVCPSCGRDVEPDWKVCPYCTETLTRVCSKCGTEARPEWKFCPYCTAEL
jgi:uncharacterized OB-fold protein